MSHIKNIEIKNFKSIRHAKIEDCRRVNVFIGYPNVGKSNILEALGLYSIDENNFNFASFIRIENLTTLFHDGDISSQSEVRVNNKNRFVARFRNDSIEFSQQFEREGTSFEKKDTGQLFLDDSSDVDIVKSFSLSENNRNVLDYRFERIPKEKDAIRVAKYEFLKSITYSTKGYSHLSIPYGDNIFNIIASNIKLKKEVEELFIPYKLELVYDTRQQRFTILKRASSGIFSVPYELVADTLQRIIFYKAAILSNKGKVLLFEEPEAHMFPPYVSKFSTDVMYDKNDNQFFIATHSPFVLNDFMEDMKNEDLAIYAVGYSNGETTINRLTDKQITDIYQYGVDLFFNLEDFLKDVVS